MANQTPSEASAWSATASATYRRFQQRHDITRYPAYAANSAAYNRDCDRLDEFNQSYHNRSLEAMLPIYGMVHARALQEPWTDMVANSLRTLGEEGYDLLMRPILAWEHQFAASRGTNDQNRDVGGGDTSPYV